MRMAKKMTAMLMDIPVWPKEVRLEEVCKKHCVAQSNIPTFVPIGEEKGWACWMNQKIKDKFFREVCGEDGK